MSRRGYYIGGHTVIGPNSGWFSKNKGGKKKKRRLRGRSRRAKILAAHDFNVSDDELRRLERQLDAERRALTATRKKIATHEFNIGFIESKLHELRARKSAPKPKQQVSLIPKGRPFAVAPSRRQLTPLPKVS
jgi:hypothetical protein